MSKKKKSFWTNLPALIGKITGLLVVIGTIIQMCQSPGVSIWSDDEPTSYSSTNDVTVISPREVIPSLTVINKGRDYWAKEGYYLEFDSLYKIWPIDIRSRADSAKVKITDNNNRILVRKKLHTGDRIIFKREQFIYFVTLVKIGRAGKNPFRRAAFFKVQKGSRKDQEK